MFSAANHLRVCWAYHFAWANPFGLLLLLCSCVPQDRSKPVFGVDLQGKQCQSISVLGLSPIYDKKGSRYVFSRNPISSMSEAKVP